MNELEIKIQLRKALNRLLEMLPDDLQAAVRDDLYIAGGAIVNLLLGVPVIDYDIFIKTDSSRDKIKEFFSIRPADFGRIVITENAITIPNGDLTLQIVTRFTCPVDRVFKSFDFEHCKAYYDLSTDELKFNFEVIFDRKLVYTGEKDEYTLNTLKRLVKFVNRGWVPDNDTILNLHRAIQNRPHIDLPEERAKQTVGFYGSSMS